MYFAANSIQHVPSQEAKSSSNTQKISPHMEPTLLLLCSQQLISASHPVPDEFSPHPPIPFLSDSF